MIFQIPSTYEALLFRYYKHIISVTTYNKSKESGTYLQVIRMLPHINSKKRRVSSHWILILRRHDLQLPLGLIGNQPTPSTSLDPQQSSRENLLKCLVATPLPLNRSLDTGGGLELRLRGAGGGQVLPEEGVVDVATAVEFDLLL